MNQSPETLPDPKTIALISHITQLMDEVEELLHDSNNQQEEVTTEMSPPSNRNSPMHASTFFPQAGEKIVAGARRADKIIHANPYRSLALALSAGAFLGVMLARRNSAPT